MLKPGLFPSGLFLRRSGSQLSFFRLKPIHTRFQQVHKGGEMSALDLGQGVCRVEVMGDPSTSARHPFHELFNDRDLSGTFLVILRQLIVQSVIQPFTVRNQCTQWITSARSVLSTVGPHLGGPQCSGRCVTILKSLYRVLNMMHLTQFMSAAP